MSTSASDSAAPLALTVGDPAGIGPDLVAALATELARQPVVVIGDRDVLGERADQLNQFMVTARWEPELPLVEGRLNVWHTPVRKTVTPGQPDSGNAESILACLERAAKGCQDGTFSGMVTAPLSKQVIIEAGYSDFTGHTEYLSAQAEAPQVVMMLAAGKLRVALATTHLPLRQVPDAITEARLEQVTRTLHQDLERHFAVARPRILVLGLNPHAGEGGHLGDEEIRVMEPVLERLRAEGMRLTGPVPADTAFNPEQLEDHDAVLAMYHDQGLPVLKYAGFGEAVNVTLGLPWIRTSVDHGTAFALAGTGRARPGSLRAALALALELRARRS